MLELLRDFYGHQAWADSQHWNAFEAHPGALGDEQIWKRLYHLHIAQYAFLTIAQQKPPAYRRLEEFTCPALLKEFAASTHEAAHSYLGNCSEAMLANTVTIPWIKDPPLVITVGQALLQASMHSQYHRAQNATRLRELGGSPPLTDYILWIWNKRPTARWDVPD